MNIEKLRWWHWLVISVALGALCAAARVFYGPGFDRGNPRTIIDYFERDAANVPIRADDPHLDEGIHPSYLEDIVVHPPDHEKIKAVMAYVLDVQSGSTVYEVEIKDDHVIQKREKNGPGESLVLPVLWQNVSLDKVPPEVSATAQAAVEGGSIIAAHLGPTEIHYWVTGYYVESKFLPRDRSDPNSERVLTYLPEAFMYESTVPYKVPAAFNELRHNARGATPAPNYDSAKAPGEFPTVMGYLDALKIKYPTSPISYRFAWWEEPKWVYTIWIAGSVLIIGLIWPAVLSLLMNAGFGRAPSEDYDLSRFKGEKTSARPVPATAADLGNVTALNDQLEAGLLAGATSASAPAAVPGAEQAPVSRPAPPPLEPAAKATEAPSKPKTFGTEGGAYYPTEIHLASKKKPDDQ